MTPHEFTYMVAKHTPSITIPLSMMGYTLFYTYLHVARPDRVLDTISKIHRLPYSWYTYSHTESTNLGYRDYYRRHTPRNDAYLLLFIGMGIACMLPTYFSIVILRWVMEANNNHVNQYTQALMECDPMATMVLVGGGICKAPWMSILFFAVTIGIPTYILHLI